MIRQIELASKASEDAAKRAVAVQEQHMQFFRDIHVQAQTTASDVRQELHGLIVRHTDHQYVTNMTTQSNLHAVTTSQTGPSTLLCLYYIYYIIIIYIIIISIFSHCMPCTGTAATARKPYATAVWPGPSRNAAQPARSPLDTATRPRHAFPPVATPSGDYLARGHLVCTWVCTTPTCICVCSTGS